jgi:hypothetical protein
VIPLDICSIVLGSSYLFDKKDIFYRENNKYPLFNNEIEYIVRAHCIKTNVSLVRTWKMKRLVLMIKIERGFYLQSVAKAYYYKLLIYIILVGGTPL